MTTSRAKIRKSSTDKAMLVDGRKIIKDYRLNNKQFEAFLIFLKTHTSTLGIMSSEESYQFIRGWFQGQGIDDYPAVMVILDIWKGSKWKVIETIGQPDGEYQPMHYIGVTAVT